MLDARVCRSSSCVTAVATALLAAGCGGGGDGDGAAACPSPATTFETMNAASYVVVAVLRVPADPRTGAPERLIPAPFGTAFAVGERLLATNAHITELFNTGSPDYTLKGLIVHEVVAVQAGTGTVVTLLRALTHPAYGAGDPLGTPDVGLFTSREVLPVTLPMATAAEMAALEIGAPIQLTGFPGDVNELIAVVPRETVPQATSLSGQITAFRSHDPREQVTAENTDVIQHQAPTTPGTSGSAMVSCGKLIAVNNAGTVQLVLEPLPDGTVRIQRVAAASNNFGVHVRYVGEMVSLFGSQALQGFALPPPFVPATGGGGQGGVAAFAGTYQGAVTGTTRPHTFTFTIAQDGSLTGTSTWATQGSFTLSGSVNAGGQVQFTDNAQAQGLATGIYAGSIAANGQAQGTYSEETAANVLANWTAARQ